MMYLLIVPFKLLIFALAIIMLIVPIPLVYMWKFNKSHVKKFWEDANDFFALPTRGNDMHMFKYVFNYWPK